MRACFHARVHVRTRALHVGMSALHSLLMTYLASEGQCPAPIAVEDDDVYWAVCACACVCVCMHARSACVCRCWPPLQGRL